VCNVSSAVETGNRPHTTDGICCRADGDRRASRIVACMQMRSSLRSSTARSTMFPNGGICTGSQASATVCRAASSQGRLYGHKVSRRGCCCLFPLLAHVCARGKVQGGREREQTTIEFLSLLVKHGISVRLTSLSSSRLTAPLLGTWRLPPHPSYPPVRPQHRRSRPDAANLSQ